MKVGHVERARPGSTGMFWQGHCIECTCLDKLLLNGGEQQERTVALVPSLWLSIWLLDFKSCHPSGWRTGWLRTLQVLSQRTKNLCAFPWNHPTEMPWAMPLSLKGVMLLRQEGEAEEEQSSQGLKSNSFLGGDKLLTWSFLKCTYSSCVAFWVPTEKNIPFSFLVGKAIWFPTREVFWKATQLAFATSASKGVSDHGIGMGTAMYQPLNT